MSKVINIVGQCFNKLLVIERTSNDKWGNACWLCLCDCGSEIIVRTAYLKNNHTQSCGCLSIEKIVERSIKHGYKKRGTTSRTYTSWQLMIQRCINPNNPAYKNYGGRGIKVCQQWRNSFENFLKDMGEAPNGLQLDRIKNDQGYCKKNCHWATSKQQNRNKRNNCLITYNGKTQCLIEWAEEIGINYQTLQSRLRQAWSIERMLKTPVRRLKNN